MTELGKVRVIDFLFNFCILTGVVLASLRITGIIGLSWWAIVPFFFPVTISLILIAIFGAR